MISNESRLRRMAPVACGAMMFAAPGLAAAQAAAAPQPAPQARPGAAPARPAAGGNQVEGVTVTGQGAEVRTSIDRRSYDVTRDLQATSGSMADALRNVPSLEVDVDGNLSLRGDPNVTVMIDGRPAPLLNGQNKGDALQALPADRIARVEVITNPSAAFSAEGAGGIINLITKQSTGAGKTGSVYGLFGSQSAGRVGGTVGYNTKKLALTGSASSNYQNNKGANERERVRDTAAGPLTTEETLFGRNLNRSQTLQVTGSYALTARDQLTADVRYNMLHFRGYPRQILVQPGAAGPVRIFSQTAGRRVENNDVNLSTGWKRKLGGDDHEFSADLTYNTSAPREHSNYFANQILPAAPLLVSDVLANSDQSLTELKLAYSRPLGEAKLKTGYEWRDQSQDFLNQVARGASLASLVIDPSVTNRFIFDETIHTLYATYERPIGDLTLQAGLRVEAVNTDLDQVTSHIKAGSDDVAAYPTLHLAYKLDDARQLTASYSHRITRPPPFFLNPFRSAGAFAGEFSQGNPNLKNAGTHSFEVAYQRRQGQTFYLATLFYRRNYNQFVGETRSLPNGDIVQTVVNIGKSRAAGLELVANGRLSKSLTYTTNATAFWRQIDAVNLGFADRRSNVSATVRGNLNWQATPNDCVQLNGVIYTGKILVPQGYARQTGSVNLGWRRKVNDRVTMVVTAQDVLGTIGFRQVLDAPGIKERTISHPVARSLTVRLDYRLGGGPARNQRQPGFEYEGGGAGAAGAAGAGGVTP